MDHKIYEPSYAKVIFSFNVEHLDEYKIIYNDLGFWSIIHTKSGRVIAESSVKFHSGKDKIKSLIYDFYFKIGV